LGHLMLANEINHPERALFQSSQADQNSIAIQSTNEQMSVRL
jgi:hypothetical protein